LIKHLNSLQSKKNILLKIYKMNKLINGGRNNKVYLFKSKKKKFIIKKYKNNYSTKYNRFLTEKIFLEFLVKKKIKNIPKIISLDKKKKIIVFNYICGKQIKKVQKKHLNQCLKFLLKINYKTSYKNFKFQKASDACLSLNDHIKTCETRIKRLIKNCHHNSKGESKKILFFLKNKILPEFKKIKSKIHLVFSKSQIVKKINKKQLILSPSDFGFHNIISKKNKLYYIDFEYSGWDDPNKLISDFFLNPDYFISKKNKKYFLRNFDNFFKKKISNSSKFKFILKFHFLKWVCVIINQTDLKVSKKHRDMNYFKKAVNYFETNINILK